MTIRYQGSPKKGLYFILPNKSYSTQPKEIWTQGEAEDTRYYIPIYDYPNDRTTTEMIVTVPRDWVTVSNGKLESVVDAGQGMKTWTWRQSQPISTYLISLVAGEFDESKKPGATFPWTTACPAEKRSASSRRLSRTPDMLSFFSDRLGVPYPWDKYDQTAVDQFTLGGMENVSATTLTARGLLHPALAHESLEGADGLISHEMSHQWFGDLVTCKDWANLVAQRRLRHLHGPALGGAPVRRGQCRVCALARAGRVVSAAAALWRAHRDPRVSTTRWSTREISTGRPAWSCRCCANNWATTPSFTRCSTILR